MPRNTGVVRAHRQADRATEASPGARAGLRHSVGIACASCGKFISYADCLDGARFEFEPLSEFGPERGEWICKRCVKQEINRDGERANNASPSNQ